MALQVTDPVKSTADAPPSFEGVDAPPGHWSEAHTAAVLHTTAKTLRTWASRRQGPPRVKSGRAIFYNIASVLAWLRSREVSFDDLRERRP